MNKKITTIKGFVLIEALISIVILSMIAFSVFPIVSFLVKKSGVSKYEGRASLVLQEGIEVSYNVLISDWERYADGRYSIFVDETLTPVTWELVATNSPDENIDTIFSRTINVRTICRNITTGVNVGLAPCAGDSHEDRSTRLIESVVTWNEAGINKDIEASLLIANF